MEKKLIYIIAITIILFYGTNVNAQVKKIHHQYKEQKIEILFYSNHDKYAEFHYHINPNYD